MVHIIIQTRGTVNRCKSKWDYFLGNKGLLDIIMLVLAIDLVVLGLNNLLLVKNKRYALIYFVVGGIMLIGVILKMVGVHI